MKTLFFHSFWVATDLIRCPGVLGKIFVPPRLHRGCTWGGGCIERWIWGSQREKITALHLLSKFAVFAQFGLSLALVWPKFDLVWSIWLILYQLCCINDLSVALFHQNLKLGADITLKNGYMSINITGRSHWVPLMGPRIQYTHGMGALIYP